MLIDVISVLRSRKLDIRTFKLEEATILTLKGIRKRRELANFSMAEQRPTIGFAGCSVASRSVTPCP